MGILIAVLVLAILAYIAKKAGMGKAAKFFGGAAVLAFIWWLSTGPGFTVLNWIEDPAVDVPDQIPIPGQ